MPKIKTKIIPCVAGVYVAKPITTLEPEALEVIDVCLTPVIAWKVCTSGHDDVWSTPVVIDGFDVDGLFAIYYKDSGDWYEGSDMKRGHGPKTLISWFDSEFKKLCT